MRSLQRFVDFPTRRHAKLKHTAFPHGLSDPPPGSFDPNA
ncbi:hypothetical protein GZL_03501 [Streptomyces sp. 769]|nr:hypothetical protein GZL_03501 [Streptomyces sp. 769]